MTVKNNHDLGDALHDQLYRFHDHLTGELHYVETLSIAGVTQIGAFSDECDDQV